MNQTALSCYMYLNGLQDRLCLFVMCSILWCAQDVGSWGLHFQNPNSPKYLNGKFFNINGKFFQNPNSPEYLLEKWGGNAPPPFAHVNGSIKVRRFRVMYETTVEPKIVLQVFFLFCLEIFAEL